MSGLSLEFWIGTGLAVFAIAIGIALTVAMDAKTKGEFRIAAICFIFSGLIVSYGIGALEVSSPIGVRYRLIIAGIFYALVFIGVGETIRWAHSRHLKASGVAVEAKGSKESSSSPTKAIVPEPSAKTTPLPPEKKEPRPESKIPQNVAPAGFISFLGQVINGMAPVMQENQTNIPLDDVHLSIFGVIPANESPTSDSEWGTGKLFWQKEIEVGTVRALLTKGLDDRFPVAGESRIFFNIIMQTRLRTYTEKIYLTKNGTEYNVKMEFDQAPKERYIKTMGLAMVEVPSPKS